MENREKFEIPTIAFTEVTLLTTASSTCSGECSGYREGTDKMFVDQNSGSDM